MVQHTPNASEQSGKQNPPSPPSAVDPAEELAGHEAEHWHSPVKADEGSGPGEQAAPVSRAQDQPSASGATSGGSGGSGGPNTDADPGRDKTGRSAAKIYGTPD